MFAVLLATLFIGGVARGSGPIGPDRLPARGHAVAGVRTCGTAIPDAREFEAIRREIDRRLGIANATRSLLRTRPGLTAVDVYVHVITADGGSVGDVSQRIRAQVDALNAGFRGAEDPAAADMGFEFRLLGSDVTDNATWFRGCSDAEIEAEMKSALYAASPAEARHPSVLHLYTCDAGGLLGYAYYPWSVVGTNFEYLDGVVVHFQTLPGGEFEFPDAGDPDGVLNYSSGETGTHEAGHWLGLQHTFDGACGANGDGIDDTPSERAPAYYCVARDSCPGRARPGLDPIRNYMDYTDDDCYVQFTPQQASMTLAVWEAFRAGQ
jgi:hypothetical protein